MLYQIEFLTLRTLTFERHQDIRKQFCLLILMFKKHLRLINDVNSRNSNNLWLNPSFAETRWMDRIIMVTKRPSSKNIKSVGINGRASASFRSRKKSWELYTENFFLIISTTIYILLPSQQGKALCKIYSYDFFIPTKFRSSHFYGNIAESYL